MSSLETQPNIAHPDDVYELLISMHEGLSEAESWRVNARLIMILVNQIGDEQVVREAIAAARESSHNDKHLYGEPVRAR